jgi:ABC-type lipoprotein export system ATPase subunit
MLACAGVSRRLGGRQVLIECGLSVAPGTCTVIRGPSGGGKSTLLKILALLEPADSGLVTHDAQAYAYPLARDFPLCAFPYLTLVFQQLYLWPNLTLRENMALVLDGDRAAPLDASARELLKRFAVHEQLDRRPHECSLGQRQRVAVARALLTPAKYLLLDEPTSALDRVNRAAVIAALQESKAMGRGLLIVSHDEGGLERIADARYELEDARLVPS